MVRLDDHTISLGTMIALVALCGSGFAAWSDVKSDIAVNSTNVDTYKEDSKETEQRIEKRLERIEDKLDRLIEGRP